MSSTTRTCGVHLAVDEFHDLALIGSCDPVLDAIDGRDRTQDPGDCRTYIFGRQIFACWVERRDSAGLTTIRSPIHQCSQGRYSNNADRPTMSTMVTANSAPYASVSRNALPNRNGTGCCRPSSIAMLSAYR